MGTLYYRKWRELLVLANASENGLQYGILNSQLRGSVFIKVDKLYTRVSFQYDSQWFVTPCL